jgi:hypothetical protein
MIWVDILLGALFVVPFSWIAAVFVRNVIANRGRPDITAVDKSAEDLVPGSQSKESGPFEVLLGVLLCIAVLIIGVWLIISAIHYAWNHSLF